MFTDYLTTQIGLIEISASDTGIHSVYFVDQPRNSIDKNKFTALGKTQLQAYFSGERKDFDLPLDQQQGTAFQQQVWQALLTIPYGQVASYLDVANTINNPKAVRAVGAANGKNPISIIVPCHRVIGANGTLTGYAGGVERKQWLLQHEGMDMFKV